MQKKNEDPNYIVEKNEVMDDIELAQNSGQRVIAFAISRDTEVVEYDGFCVIEDPIRVEVPEAISKAINAGIKPVIVTGDNHLTDINIGMQIGLIDKMTICLKYLLLENSYHVCQMENLTED